MKRFILLILALLAELGASCWTWVRSPTDSLRALYLGSFWDYELERLIPWSVIMASGILAWLLVQKYKRL